MAALAADRNTYAKTAGPLKQYKVKGATKIYMGALVALTGAGGFLVPAADAAALIIVGRADQKVDNTAGADGALFCLVQEGIFKWDNSAVTPIVQATMGDPVYAEDDHTVSKDGGTNTIKAGVALSIDDDGGIWVKTMPTGGI